MAYRAKCDFSNLYGVYAPGDEVDTWSGKDIEAALAVDLIEAFEPEAESFIDPPLDDDEEEEL